MTWLETGLRLNPTSGAITHGVARILAASPDPALRDGERAVEMARRVVEALPTLGHVRTLAMALAENGACEDAAGLLRQALAAAGDQADPEMTALTSTELERYERGAPCRPPAPRGSGDRSRSRIVPKTHRQSSICRVRRIVIDIAPDLDKTDASLLVELSCRCGGGDLDTADRAGERGRRFR